MIRLKNILTEAIAAKFEPIKLKHKFKDYAPSFDEETMKTHYGKHYQAYIDKLNEAVVEFNVLDAKRASWNREVDIWRTLSANQRR